MVELQSRFEFDFFSFPNLLKIQLFFFFQKNTQEFLRVCFSTAAIQGYGLTESCAVSLVQNAFLPPKVSCFFFFQSLFYFFHKYFTQPCIAGAPLNSVEVSFRDCPESGYETSKLQKTVRNGMEILMCGEGFFSFFFLAVFCWINLKKKIVICVVCLRGNPVFKGYYKKPELTKEAITENGWFKTGDIGIIYTDGSIQIVDRVKNISKLSHGSFSLFC